MRAVVGVGLFVVVSAGLVVALQTSSDRPAPPPTAVTTTTTTAATASTRSAIASTNVYRDENRHCFGTDPETAAAHGWQPDPTCLR